VDFRLLVGLETLGMAILSQRIIVLNLDSSVDIQNPSSSGFNTNNNNGVYNVSLYRPKVYSNPDNSKFWPLGILPFMVSLGILL